MAFLSSGFFKEVNPNASQEGSRSRKNKSHDQLGEQMFAEAKKRLMDHHGKSLKPLFKQIMPLAKKEQRTDNENKLIADIKKGTQDG